MITYTERDLAMNVDGDKYLLETTVDDNTLESVKKLFVDTCIFGFLVNEKRPVNVDETYQTIEIPSATMIIYLHPFQLKDGPRMIAVRAENAEGALLDELIDINVMPKIVKGLGLKRR